MDFHELNLKELDKNLTEEERKEWNGIYASYRSRSVLTGKVAGPEIFRASQSEDGISLGQCLAVIGYRVKILIPERELWLEQEGKPSYILNSMIGAEVDYVITHIDRENGWCVGSRKLALLIRRRQTLKTPPEAGQLVTCRVTAPGRNHILLTCGGYDVTALPKDMSYTMLPDLRDRFHAGESLTAVVKQFDPERNLLSVSVREAQPNPFDGADMRHPVNCRRAAVIGGKYGGIIFCRLEENLDCLCTYSPSQCDMDFSIGDQVIVAITRYNYEKKQIYGKIIAKW